jgi:hypothetical protein
MLQATYAKSDRNRNANFRFSQFIFVLQPANTRIGDTITFSGAVGNKERALTLRECGLTFPSPQEKPRHSNREVHQIDVGKFAVRALRNRVKIPGQR